MESKEIIEGNRLIAEFMGYQISGDGDKRPYKIIKPKQREWYFASWSKEGFEEHLFEEFRYDRSWDALMPVVEKIGQTYNIRIQVNICSITRRFMEHKAYMKEHNISFDEVPPIAECNESTFVGNVWQCCVDFIKWYNSTTSKTEGE